MHEMDLKLADASTAAGQYIYHLEVNLLPVARIVGFIHPLDSKLEAKFCYKIYILLRTVM